MSDLMSPNEIQDALAEVPGWNVEGISIVREFELETFAGAIAFVVGIAISAEKLSALIPMSIISKKEMAPRNTGRPKRR